MAKHSFQIAGRSIAFVALILSLASCSDTTPTEPTAEATSINCAITRVVDGDTIDLKCAGTPTERVRLKGYDTAETYRPSCAAEKRFGTLATEHLKSLVRQFPVTQVDRDGTDFYQRTLARVWLGGVDIRDLMLSEGLAVRYNGGARISWCARLATAGLT